MNGSSSPSAMISPSSPMASGPKRRSISWVVSVVRLRSLTAPISEFFLSCLQKRSRSVPASPEEGDRGRIQRTSLECLCQRCLLRRIASIRRLGFAQFGTRDRKPGFPGKTVRSVILTGMLWINSDKEKDTHHRLIPPEINYNDSRSGSQVEANSACFE
jgi:hypothetical protein